MHGLQFIDATEPGLADRLLGRKPKENAFIEINNIVASVPAAELTRECIAGRLEAHGITADEARPRLLSLYAQVLRHYVQDWAVTEDAAATLARLRELFGLNRADTGHVLAAIVLPFYERAAAGAVADRKLTDGEREYLETLVARLGIPQHVAREIYDRCARHVYRTALARHAAARRLSPDEEADLARLAADLNVVVHPGSHDEAMLRRLRYLWELSQGKFLPVPVPVHLPAGEACAAHVPAMHSEARAASTVCYSGYPHLVGTPGVSFRSGSVWTQRVAGGGWRSAGSGTLYFTNRALLFYGQHKTTQTPLSEVRVATFYSDGMLVETESGLVRTFCFEGDIEVLHALFDGLMTASQARPAP